MYQPKYTPPSDPLDRDTWNAIVAAERRFTKTMHPVQEHVDARLRLNPDRCHPFALDGLCELKAMVRCEFQTIGEMIDFVRLLRSRK